MSLPPPPSREKDITGPAWQKWFSLIKEAVSPISEGGKQAWDQISKAGSRLTDIERRNHSDLQNLNSDTASHLTLVQLNELTGGLETNFHIHDHSLLTNPNSTNYTHLTAVNHTDLTDGGTTELHLHDFDHVTFPTTNFIGTPSHIYTLQELMNHEWSAGVVDGCALTDNGDGTISIASGVAVIRAVPDGHTTLFGVALSAQLNITLTDDSTNYVYLDYNSGSPLFSVSTVITSFNCMDKCIAYMVHRKGNVLHWVDAREQNVDSNRKLRQWLLKQNRFSHDTGGSALGSVSGLTLSLTAGACNFMLQAIPHDAFDTSIAGTANVNVFTLWTKAGSVWTETANTKVIDSTLWNDTATGTVTLNNNKYGVSWVYVVNDTPSELHVVMGQQEYANYSSAIVASPPVSVPTLVAGFGILVGLVVYEKSVTVFDNILSAFTQTFSPSQASLHNGLSGLQGGTINEYFHLTSAQNSLIPSGTPSVGQVPTATSATTSTWQTPSSGGSGTISNVISTPTTIATDTSYPVISYLTVNSDLTINGNLMVIG